MLPFSHKWGLDGCSIDNLFCYANPWGIRLGRCHKWKPSCCQGQSLLWEWLCLVQCRWSGFCCYPILATGPTDPWLACLCFLGWGVQTFITNPCYPCDLPQSGLTLSEWDLRVTEMARAMITVAFRTVSMAHHQRLNWYPVCEIIWPYTIFQNKVITHMVQWKWGIEAYKVS